MACAVFPPGKTERHKGKTIEQGSVVLHLLGSFLRVANQGNRPAVLTSSLALCGGCVGVGKEGEGERSALCPSGERDLEPPTSGTEGFPSPNLPPAQAVVGGTLLPPCPNPQSKWTWGHGDQEPGGQDNSSCLCRCLPNSLSRPQPASEIKALTATCPSEVSTSVSNRRL